MKLQQEHQVLFSDHAQTGQAKPWRGTTKLEVDAPSSGMQVIVASRHAFGSSNPCMFAVCRQALAQSADELLQGFHVRFGCEGCTLCCCNRHYGSGLLKGHSSEK